MLPAGGLRRPFQVGANEASATPPHGCLRKASIPNYRHGPSPPIFSPPRSHRTAASVIRPGRLNVDHRLSETIRTMNLSPRTAAL